MQLKKNMNLGNLKVIIFITIFFLSISSTTYSALIEGNKVKIKILNKITTKIQTIEIQVNKFYEFESLSIEIYSCYKNPPEDIPESYVLLRIYDKKELKQNYLTYQGWMISSSPATTPLEHPIYDLWLINCKTDIDF